MAPALTVDGWQLAETDVIAGAAETGTIVDPTMLGCWVLVAATVTFSDVVGAVNSPEAEIVPALADQFTAELKLPVPCTFAEHWAAPPGVTADGWQLTEIEVIVTGAVTVTTVDPFVAGCWALVAVTVTFPAVDGGVRTPAGVMVPALADQLTAEL